MPYTTIPTVVTGDIIPASYGNLLKGDLDYHQAFLDGTGSGTIVTLNGCELRVGKSVPGGDPGVIADTLSIFTNKSNADHEIVFFNDTTSPSAGALEFAFWQRAYSTTAMTLGITNDGKLTGKGFYDSGELSMAASATTSPAHGLGAKPRFVFGYWSATTGEVAGTAATGSIGLPGATVSLTSVSSTTIVVQNTAGATRYARVLALL